MYNLTRGFASIVHLHLYNQDNQVMEAIESWTAEYSAHTLSEYIHLQQVYDILLRVKQNKLNEPVINISEIIATYNISFFTLAENDKKECLKQLTSLYELLSLKEYFASAAEIERLLISQTANSDTTAQIMSICIHKAIFGQEISKLIAIYKGFISEGAYTAEWHIEILENIYKLAKAKLSSTRLSNEDIEAFRNFEIYNGIRKRIELSRLVFACFRLNVAGNEAAWGEFYYQLASHFNKYKGLLNYLEIFGAEEFSAFLKNIEQHINNSQRHIQLIVDSCQMEPREINYIEHIIHERADVSDIDKRKLHALYGRQMIIKALTELHLLAENNFLLAKIEHRLELNKYYSSLDGFQKIQLAKEMQQLADDALRFITQQYYAPQIVNHIIIENIVSYYYPDQLYSEQEINADLQSISLTLAEIDFSALFAGKRISDNYVNKFISKIVHSPRPFSNKEEFIDSVVNSMAHLLDDKQISVIANGHTKNNTAVQKILRRAVLARLNERTNFWDYLTSTFSKAKREEYLTTQTLKKLLTEEQETA